MGVGVGLGVRGQGLESYNFKNMAVKSFTDLLVWQKSHAFVIEIYKSTANFPKDEVFILTSQLRRAAISIPNNIAEGSGRHSTREYLQFLINSRGSCEECKYLVILSKDLKYISVDSYHLLTEQIEEIGKMLNGLITSLKNKL